MNLVQGAGNSLIKWGSQVQWAGRQLTYNFTLPLAIAGVAAGKWALDIESSFVRVRKVYGDFSLSSDVMNSELDALQRNFEALSNHFGVHQKEVNEIAGDWAAAGASGKALANGVRMTLEAMILGEMEAAEATEALIAVQAQYSFSTEQMRDAIASLNMVENETGATMQDLIVSMARSAGTARDAGVDIEHLAAMTAALVPASGSAATAGNGLRTIISRLLAPTKQAAELLGMMGYSMEDLSWGSLTADQRLETLAGEFVKLDKAQRAYITTQVASRWQINRFSVLMRDIASEHGYYQKALDATADKERNALQVRQELNAVLSSNPARLKQMWTLLQNGMADVIQPLIPWVVYLASEIAKLVNNFNNLSPTLQKAIIFGVAFLALVGPIGRYIGAAAVFVGTLTKAFGWLTRSLFTVTAVTKVMSDGTVKATKAFGGLLPFILRLIRAPFNVLFTAIGAVVGMFARLPQVGAAVLAWARTFGTAVTTALTGPIGIAIVAAIALIAIFWKDIQSFFTQFVDNMRGQAGGIQKAFSPIVEFFHKAVESVIRAFNALPQAIQRPLRAVVDMVKRVAMAVYNWFSYLNPFQRHSPSLVESVTWGMAIVRKQYESIDGVRGIFKRAAGDLVAYKKMLASMNFDEWAGERENVAEVMPQGLPLFDKLVKELKVLNQLLIAQGNAVKKQEKVVERWSKKLEKANEALDKQRKVLDSIQAEMDELQAVYDGHQDALDRYASAGIIGMQAMSDKIFDNEMAQKRLRLEILRMEEAGFSVEDVQSKMAALQGEIEGLFGLMKDLERNGAGSDVTGPIADRIKELQKAYDDAGNTIGDNPINELQKQLEELERQGEILDLENSLEFDPLLRQIDQLVNGVDELSFDAIIDGINRERQAMADLEPELERVRKRYEEQKAIVDELERQRDKVEERYDKEAKKLRELRDEYELTRDAIRDIEDALRAVSGLADSTSKKGKKSGSDWRDIVGDWDDPGGMSGLGREGGLEDQSALIDEMTKELQDELNQTLASLDITGGIKAWFGKARDWWNANIIPAWDALVSGIGTSLRNVDTSGFTAKLDAVKTWLSNFGNAVRPFIDMMRRTFGEQFTAIVENIRDAFGPAVEGIAEKLGPLWETIKQFASSLGGAFKSVAPVIGAVAAVVGGVLYTAFTIIVGIVRNTVGPVIKTLGAIFEWIIGIVKTVAKMMQGAFRVVGGLVDIIVGLFTLDWDKLGEGWSNVWRGFGDFFYGVWVGIGETLENAYNVIGGILEIIAGAVSGVFSGLWDALQGIWSLIVDKVDSVTATVKKFFSDMWKSVTTWVKRIVTNVTTWFRELPNKIAEAVGNGALTLWQWGADLATGIGEGVVNGWNTAYDWFVNLANTVAQAVGDGTMTLFGWGNSVAESIGNGVISGWKTVSTWFSNLWRHVRSAVGTVNTRLSPKGRELIDGIRSGVTERWNSVKSWFSSMWTKARSAIGNVTGSLLQKGRDLITGIKSGITALWNGNSGPAVWLRNTGTRAAGAIGNVLNSLKEKGKNLIQGLKNGVVALWESGSGPLNWFKNIGTRIANAIGNVSKVLFDKGKQMMQGFFDGLKEVWETVKEWGSNLNPFGGAGRAGTSSANVSPFDAADRAFAATGTAATRVYSNPPAENKIYNFYGNLEFPNVSNGDDAKSFLDNLDSLAGGEL